MRNDSRAPNDEEERYPLLMLFFDDANKANRRSKAILIDKSRYKNIASGAAAVLNDWPSHVTGCWLTTLFIALTLLAVTFVLFAAAIAPLGHVYLPRCPTGAALSPNKTRIYLARGGDRPLTADEIETIVAIVKHYPRCDVQITLYDDEIAATDGSSTISTGSRRNARSVTSSAATSTSSPHVRSSNSSMGSLLDLLVAEGMRRRGERRKSEREIIVESVADERRPRDLHDLLSRYDAIRCVHVSRRQLFENSPLFAVYDGFTPELTAFAARVLQLWDRGGISYALPPERDGQESMKAIGKLVETGYESYARLGDGSVTVDEEGLHMASKTTCHAFFGELLHYLRRAAPTTTTAGAIVKETLKAFCGREAVDSKYCKSLI